MPQPKWDLVRPFFKCSIGAFPTAHLGPTKHLGQCGFSCGPWSSSKSSLKSDHQPLQARTNDTSNVAFKVAGSHRMLYQGQLRTLCVLVGECRG